eukprot:m.48871 g.48871  ORF g.48871 m.48871 type:complete len:150 (+) comp15278_c0_seq5:520-969(+)
MSCIVTTGLYVFVNHCLCRSHGVDLKDWVIPVPSTLNYKSIGMHNTGTMMMKWQTPLYTVNFRSVFSKASDFNNDIAAAVLHKYQELLDAGGDKLSHVGWKSNGANQQFFEWQMNGGWNASFGKLKHYRNFLHFIHAATDTYLMNMGAS